MRTLTARRDERLTARVESRLPLFYSGGADLAADRPAHIRAASAVAPWNGRLAIVQDDVNVIALLDPATGRIDAHDLPRGAGGRRQFDDLLGNKSDKLDLELAFSVPRHTADGGDLLVALGSGATPARVHVALLDGNGARLASARELYDALSRCLEFAGSQLNLEGAALLSDRRVRLFQRGNGAPRPGLPALDATADIDLDAFLAYLDGASPPPVIDRVVTYELGSLDGSRLTFSDAAVAGDVLHYLASAERSPDAIADGVVVGSVLGHLAGADGAPVWAPLTDELGHPLAIKAEALAFDPARPDHALILLDADDPARPAELCLVHLSGPWP
jgi:hypothetical protein